MPQNFVLRITFHICSSGELFNEKKRIGVLHKNTCLKRVLHPGSLKPAKTKECPWAYVTKTDSDYRGDDRKWKH